MQIGNLKPADGATTKKVRVGRGIGSGIGKTSGRGQKGQNARSGGGVKAGFEGGNISYQKNSYSWLQQLQF